MEGRREEGVNHRAGGGDRQDDEEGCVAHPP